MSEKHKHKKHEYVDFEEGTITVSSSGDVEVTLNFIPEFIEAVFSDPDPNHHCCDVAVPDVLKVLFFEGKTFDLEWDIKSKRVIKWIAARLKK